MKPLGKLKARKFAARHVLKSAVSSHLKHTSENSLTNDGKKKAAFCPERS